MRRANSQRIKWFRVCLLPYEAGDSLLLNNKGGEIMPKYLIEREVPGVGNLLAKDVQALSQKSCSVLQNLGPQIQWVQSYVTGDKLYCVYIAPNEEMIREHAKQGGFPANRISEIKSMIDPTTAENKEQSATG
jgi:hypothetical protein